MAPRGRYRATSSPWLPRCLVLPASAGARFSLARPGPDLGVASRSDVLAVIEAA
jgi:hypothetical protein